MKIFVTEQQVSSVSAVVQELIGAGHKVIGLCSLRCGCQVTLSLQCQVHRGDLTDLENLRSGAAAADGVIHTGSSTTFRSSQRTARSDKRAIEALGSALEGSGRPLLVTSGLGTVAEGRTPTEEDAPLPPSAAYPRASESSA